MLRRTLIALAAIALLTTPALGDAEDFVGDWEGLIAGQLTMIFHITETEGELSATLDVPQQNTTGLPMDSVTVDGTTVRMTLDIVGGAYEGTLQEDGTIAGTWTQTAAPQPQELNLARQGDDS